MEKCDSNGYKRNPSIIKDTKLMHFAKSVVQSELLPFLVLFIAMIILHRFISMVPGDDVWFAQESAKHSLPDYLKWRYEVWTGRVSAEAVLYFIFKDNAALWKIINPMFIVLFSYSISRIVTEKKSLNIRERRAINWFICLGWLYISWDVLKDSVFWITGSINYLWMSAAGLFAMLPFKDAVVKEYRSRPLNVLYLIFAIYAAIGQEQVALILITFSIIINIQLYVQCKKIYKFLIVETVIIIICFLILYLAPGNFARVHSETNTWLPNYPFYGKFELGFYGIQWLLDRIVNYSRSILIMLISVLGYLILSKYKGIKNGVFTLIPFMCIGLLILANIFLIYIHVPNFIFNKIHFPQIYSHLGNMLQNLLFNFNVDFKLYSIKTIKFFIWPIMLFLIPFYLIVLYKFSIKNLYNILIYLAGICSAVIMFISPTIYASGYRTIFVMNVLMFILFIILLKNIKGVLNNKYILLFSIFPIIKYILACIIFKS